MSETPEKALTSREWHKGTGDVKCWACGGTGTVQPKPLTMGRVECARCHGVGWIKSDQQEPKHESERPAPAMTDNQSPVPPDEATLRRRILDAKARGFNAFHMFHGELLALLDALKNAENKAQVMFDLHAALGVRWGDDPYARIKVLLAAEESLDAHAQERERLTEQYDALSKEAINLAAERTFLVGGDIPETLERARAVLLQRVHDAEAERDRLTAALATLQAEHARVTAGYTADLIAGETLAADAAVHQTLDAVLSVIDKWRRGLSTLSGFTHPEGVALYRAIDSLRPAPTKEQP